MTSRNSLYVYYVRLILPSLALAAVLPLAAIAFTRYQTGASLWETRFCLKMGAAALVALCGVIAMGVIEQRFRPRIESLAQAQATWLDGLPGFWADVVILSAAGLGLFTELAIIRWQGSLFALFAFYKNLGLLACFLGLGIGYAISNRRDIPLFFTLPLMALQTVLLLVLRFSGGGLHARSLMAAPITEQVNMMLPTTAGIMGLIPVYLFLACIFTLTALALVPLGQVCGRLMTRRGRLRSYGLNLAGSLLGVGLMHGLSWLWTPPPVWFALAALGLFLLQAYSWRAAGIAILASAGLIGALVYPVEPDVDRLYSPYQLVERHGEGDWMQIRASGLHYQVALNLAESNPARSANPFLRSVSAYYEIPYVLYAAQHGAPKRVAIVGAGTGNDVAAALRMGAEHVDAVEIDPAILEFGRRYHPEKPYADPRVNIVENDARSFFKQTNNTYDLIVYGFLDSHAALSHAANVRVDSYVYTVEGIHDARKRLRPGGMLGLTYNMVAPELGRKLYIMLDHAFDGTPPRCLTAHEAGYGAVTFVEGLGENDAQLNAALAKTGFYECTATYADPKLLADVPTDDWPFFYMPRRVYPASYIGMAVLIILLSAGLMRGLVHERPGRADAPAFLLGAAFMLIETKGVAELGLTFGNTWSVIGAVIAGMLMMSFLANAAVARWTIARPLPPMLLLLSTLAAGFAIAWAGGLPPNMAGRAATVLLLTSPVFFSGMLFSLCLKSAPDTGKLMAANLLGAMLGGLLEYNAMYFGFRSLYVLAGVLYIGAYILMPRAASKTTPAPAMRAS